MLNFRFRIIDSISVSLPFCYLMQLQCLYPNQPVALSVCWGRVYCGVVGPKTRRAYSFHGSVINRAAQLAKKVCTSQ